MDKKVVETLKKVGAIITNNHIFFTSLKHTDTYINPDSLLPNTKECSTIGKLFALKFKNKKIDLVAAPAVGGIIFSQWVAFHLSKLKGKNISSVFTEKTPDKNQQFERGFEKLVKGKNVLVVEDITTTGGSVKKTVDAVRKAGGNVVAVSVIVNRDVKLVTEKTVGGPFFPLSTITVASYDEKECPLCENKVPINTDVGHGKEFLARHKKK